MSFIFPANCARDGMQAKSVLNSHLFPCKLFDVWILSVPDSTSLKVSHDGIFSHFLVNCLTVILLSIHDMEGYYSVRIHATTN